MDYLFATPYEIQQDPSGYHFSSDTELLGRFLTLNEDDRVLDVGTNNGALLCYAALHDPELLAGIDLFPEVIALAEKNLTANGIRAELSVSSLHHISASSGLSVGLIFLPPSHERIHPAFARS